MHVMPVTKKHNFFTLKSMIWGVVCNSIHNMIHKAFSTHPRPWIAFTEGPYLSFAARSVENVF
jgi:hypothetical protein